jgi:hypothetical protein
LCIELLTENFKLITTLAILAAADFKTTFCQNCQHFSRTIGLIAGNLPVEIAEIAANCANTHSRRKRSRYVAADFECEASRGATSPTFEGKHANQRQHLRHKTPYSQQHQLQQLQYFQLLQFMWLYTAAAAINAWNSLCNLSFCAQPPVDGTSYLDEDRIGANCRL